MSCILSCFSVRPKVKSGRPITDITDTPRISVDEIRAQEKERRENELAFITKYPNSRQAREMQKLPVRSVQQMREDFLKASEEFEKVEPPMVGAGPEHRRTTVQEAGLAKAHARAAKAADRTPQEQPWIPRNRFESRQNSIKSKAQTKFEEAAILAAKVKEQRSKAATVEAKPERVITDTWAIKSRPTRRGCLETKIGEKVVQSKVVLTPATIRTIALYPDAWEATKNAPPREGAPIKKITRKSSSFEKEPRSPLPPKAKSATSHDLKVDN